MHGDTSRDPLRQDKVRFSLDLTDADYKRLCAVWVERRNRGLRVSMRALILEAVHAHDYGMRPAAS